MIAKIFVSRDLEKRRGILLDQLAEKGLKIEHPDVLFIEEGTKMGIEQARVIKDFFTLRPYMASGKAVVVEELASITPDSQNALLKVLEEPPESAIILLGASTTNQLLPTVLSRCELVLLDTDSMAETEYPDVKQLMGLDIVGRFQFIEKVDDKNKLLSELIHFGHSHFERDHKNLQFAKKVLEAEAWKRANVNVRGILEYLMLTLPKM